MGDARDRYNEGMLKRSRKAFDRHQIRSRGDGRWMIQRPDKNYEGKGGDGHGWTWIMGAEIACMGHRSIAVVGDIDNVVFAYGPEDPISRIFWMGRSDSMGYVAEKARIGMTDSGKLCSDYETGVAQDDLAGMIRDSIEELRFEDKDADAEGEVKKALEPLGLYGDSTHKDARVRALAEARNSYTEESQHELISFLYEYGRGVEFESEDIYRLGSVVSARVFYAHAAVVRLAELLTAEMEVADGDRGSEGDRDAAVG